jgi:uncharacterized protein (UPF0548 family)
MISVRKPSVETIRAFLARQGELPFAYADVGASRATPPGGYRVDHHRIQLGQGQATFLQACAAVRRWEMFHLGWVELCWPDTAIVPGAVVAVLARRLGLWLLNACRIVYVIEKTGAVDRFGFAYGTMPDHVEKGEERFSVEWHHADESVWYDLLAFSRPNHWLARIGHPYARRLQKRFARDSLAAMARAATPEPSAEAPDRKQLRYP